MTSGRPAPDLLCSAHNRRGEPCGCSAVPFTDPRICRRHGGLAPQVLKKAERRAAEAERGMSGESPMVVRQQLGAWHKVQERLARKQMRKSGVLADWEHAAEQARIEQHERERALKELAPTYVAAERERAAEVQRWAATGRRGPKPTLSGEETTAPITGPELATAPITEPEPAVEPEMTTEPTRKVYRGHLAPEPPPQPFLERRGEAARDRRPKRPRWPNGRPEELPGGGLVYADVLPTPAAEHEAKRGLEAIPYEIDWDL